MLARGYLGQLVGHRTPIGDFLISHHNTQLVHNTKNNSQLTATTYNNMGNDDAIDEDNLILCCALCCANVSILPTLGCLGCSGKVRSSCC